MDQIRIGKFIKECRNGKKMTQQELADKLMVSYKTISKWECGKGLPEVSLMIPLCELLDINVNELLSGCHIEDKEYMKKAEENLVNSIGEKEINKKRMKVVVTIGIASIISCISLFAVLKYSVMEEWLKVIFMILGFILLFTSCIALCFLDNDVGYFECKHCKERFRPDIKSYIAGPHSLTTRRLKCPKCGKTSYCKKRLSK